MSFEALLEHGIRDASGHHGAEISLGSGGGEDSFAVLDADLISSDGLHTFVEFISEFWDVEVYGDGVEGPGAA